MIFMTSSIHATGPVTNYELFQSQVMEETLLMAVCLRTSIPLQAITFNSVLYHLPKGQVQVSLYITFMQPPIIRSTLDIFTSSPDGHDPRLKIQTMTREKTYGGMLQINLWMGSTITECSKC
jgi:hypothetical protein